jgi:N-methylhydantoinase A
VFERASLGAGFKLDGPAVVEEFGSTTVAFPGQHLRVDPHGILIIRAAGNIAETKK